MKRIKNVTKALYPVTVNLSGIDLLKVRRNMTKDHFSVLCAAKCCKIVQRIDKSGLNCIF